MPDFVLGSGKVYFAQRVSGVLLGERLIAETPAFSFSVKSERSQDYTSDGPIAELAYDVPTKITREGTFSTKDISSYNLALFAIASVGTASSTSGDVTADPINGGVALVADHYYQLGLAAYPLVGIRDISAVAIKTGSTTHTIAGGDYTIDLETARIYIPASGSDCAGAICTADYTRSATSWSQIATNDDGAYEGLLRFIADNTTGPDRDYLFPDVVISGNGDLALKDRAKTQELGFSLSIKKPTGYSAVYINGRPA